MHPQTEMAFPVDRSSIEPRVIEIVARALQRAPEDVHLSSSFWADLGAESLDMLDIAFSLERTFGIRVPHTDLVSRAIDRFGEDSILENGVLTSFALELI